VDGVYDCGVRRQRSGVAAGAGDVLLQPAAEP